LTLERETFSENAKSYPQKMWVSRGEKQQKP